MSNPLSFPAPFMSTRNREKALLEEDKCRLNPFRVQNIVYEILQNHLLVNKPKDLGFSFDQVYDKDETKSKIFLDLSHNWKASTPQKRPAVFIYRGDAAYNLGPHPLGSKAKYDVAESLVVEMTKVKMQVMLNCIAGPVGFAENFADYIKYPFLYFWDNIQREYCFDVFKLVNISAPEQFSVDAKDTFSVKLTIATEFHDMWAIQQDALKLKTVSTHVYTDASEKPLELQ